MSFARPSNGKVEVTYQLRSSIYNPTVETEHYHMPRVPRLDHSTVANRGQRRSMAMARSVSPCNRLPRQPQIPHGSQPGINNRLPRLEMLFRFAKGHRVVLSSPKHARQTDHVSSYTPASFHKLESLCLLVVLAFSYQVSSVQCRVTKLQTTFCKSRIRLTHGSISACIELFPY